MKTHWIFFFPVLFILVSCEKEFYDRLNDHQIIQLASDDNYYFPDHFYVEDDQEGPIIYETACSIVEPYEQYPACLELATSYADQALSWSDAGGYKRGIRSYAIEQRETEKYFEIKRQYVNSIHFFRSRVHKSSYFQPIRSQNAANHTVGIYDGSLEIGEIKECIEYLWYNHSLGISHSKVLVSRIKEFKKYYQLYLQSITTNTNNIVVWDNYIQLDKESKFLTVNTMQDRTIKWPSKDTGGIYLINNE